MKKLLFTGLFAALIVACFAQKPYKVVFYNFENLFDTIRNPEIYDEEFTPEGPKKWNTPKYTKKINNLSRVLFDIAAINKDYPVVIGVSALQNFYIFLQYFIGYTELVRSVHKGLPQDMVTTPLGNALNKTIRIKNQLSH